MLVEDAVDLGLNQSLEADPLPSKQAVDSRRRTDIYAKGRD
jgi:hypothetical protein